MNKTRLNLLIVVLIASSLVLIGTCHFGIAQSGTYTSTIISTDTTWTQANSPYNIAGNVLINSGVILTLGAGATLNLNGYMVVTGSLMIQPGATINIINASGYIQVDGVLSAVGTNAEPIQITGTAGTWTLGMISSTFYPSITFSRGSTGWNPQTSSGSTIQNTVLSSVIFSVSSSVELSNDTFNNGLSLEGNSPVVTNCKIEMGIGVTGGAPIIAGNTISGGITINGESYESLQTTYIENNEISGNPSESTAGIILLESVPTGAVIIERNTISTGTLDGIDFAIADNDKCPVFIENNTIANNGVGIDLHYGYPESVSANNIYNNAVNVKVDNNHSFNCSNNWWGTTDPTAIGKSIHDFKNDFTLGTITFEPFLETQNPEAAPNPSLPVPTPSPTLPPPIYTPSNSTIPLTPIHLQTGQAFPMSNYTAPTVPASSQNPPASRSLSISTTGFLVIIGVLLGVIAGFVVAVVVLLRRARKAAPAAESKL
jgi:hypothetical protein